MYIPKIDDYLKILTDDQVKDFVAINFSECFKPTRGKLYLKLNKEKILRKIAKLFYIFLTTLDEVANYAKMMHQIFVIIV